MNQLESDIQRTREAIGHGIETLGEKLSPERVKEEAKEALSEAKDAGVQKIKEVKQHATEVASERVRAVAGQAQEMSIRSLDFVRDNALPLALIGVGVGLLARSVRTRDERWDEQFSEEDWEGAESGRERMSTAKEEVKTRATEMAQGAKDRATEAAQGAKNRATEAAQGAKSRAKEVAQTARSRAKEVGRKAREWESDNSLASGAIALAAGLGVGLLFPTSERESALMGSARDRVFGEARRTARDVERAARETGREVRRVASDTAHH